MRAIICEKRPEFAAVIQGRTVLGYLDLAGVRELREALAKVERDMQFVADCRRVMAEVGARKAGKGA